MDIKYLIQLGITIGGWCVMVGTYTQKIKQHDKEITEIKNRQDSTEKLLKSIDNNLASLNTKMDLMLNGKLNTQGK